MLCKQFYEKINSRSAYLDDVGASLAAVWAAICACRQAGHQQPMAVLPGTGTAGGKAMHQHAPAATGSAWPQ